MIKVTKVEPYLDQEAEGIDESSNQIFEYIVKPSVAFNQP
jgi:hypothetical protein